MGEIEELASLIKIRKYVEADREQCHTLWKELTEWHREIYQDPTIGGEHPEEGFNKHLALVGPNHLWVAMHGSQIVGLTGLIMKEKQFPVVEAEIEPLIVGKSSRQKGVGTQLFETVISEARKRGVRFLSIQPVARNIETIRFLYKRGFRNLGQIELFMDFTKYTWKRGPSLHGCKFNY